MGPGPPIPRRRQVDDQLKEGQLLHFLDFHPERIVDAVVYRERPAQRRVVADRPVVFFKLVEVHDEKGRLGHLSERYPDVESAPDDRVGRCFHLQPHGIGSVKQIQEGHGRAEDRNWNSDQERDPQNFFRFRFHYLVLISRPNHPAFHVEP